ncbi:hypothetical protein Vi05172_g8719 [Venturia inaequalis]|nr:hypothetical protein Vi05172_g8719 [Venturia inaequalis]
MNPTSNTALMASSLRSNSGGVPTNCNSSASLRSNNSSSLHRAAMNNVTFIYSNPDEAAILMKPQS